MRRRHGTILQPDVREEALVALDENAGNERRAEPHGPALPARRHLRKRFPSPLESGLRPAKE